MGGADLLFATGSSLDVKNVIGLCRDPGRSTIYTNGRFEIIKAGEFAIQFGRISKESIQNQVHAAQILDPEIVRVPKIHTYFAVDGADYVVMDYIDGQQSMTDSSELISKVARIVNHLHSFTSSSPGPVESGTLSGPLWSDDERIAFTTKQDIGTYVNTRLRRQAGQFLLENTPLVFVHGDLAPRNFIFTASEVWLLDWEFAAYLPRSAEFAGLRLAANSAREWQFHCALEAAIVREKPLTGTELVQVACWLELTVNHVRFYLPTNQEKQAMFKRRRRLDGTIVK